MRRWLGLGAAAYHRRSLIALMAASRRFQPPMLVAFIIYAAFAALVHELIVGLADAFGLVPHLWAQRALVTRATSNAATAI